MFVWDRGKLLSIPNNSRTGRNHPHHLLKIKLQITQNQLTQLVDIQQKEVNLNFKQLVLVNLPFYRPINNHVYYKYNRKLYEP